MSQYWGLVGMAKKIEIIKTSKDAILRINAKSVLVSRKDGASNDEFKTAIVKTFDVNNPHKTQEFPKAVYEFSNAEKVRIRRMNVSYYLEGNDIVINDLEEIMVVREGSKITIKGYQLEVESRNI